MVRILPLIMVSNFAVFPGQIVNFELSDRQQQNAAEKALLQGDGVYIGIEQEVSSIVIYAKIVRILRDSEQSVRILIDAQARYRRVEDQEVPQGMAAAERIYENTFEGKNLQQTMLRMLKETLADSPAVKAQYAKDMELLLQIQDLSRLTDQIAAILPLEWDSRRTLMVEAQPSVRAKLLLELLHQEDAIYDLRQQIQETVMETLNKSQRDAFLHEQIRTIQDILGEGKNQELAQYAKLAENEKLPEGVRNKIKKELQHLSEITMASPEYSIYSEYLEQLTKLPWLEAQAETEDLAAVKRKLDEDHYGLEKVKDRILEYLAVKFHMKEQQSPILCLVGPPGVGKTSIAKSIAEAIGRRYVRISLGGVRDEAEIRGHRKTYIGAMPGRIMAGLRNAGTRNPLMLLDEIDKMASDLKGDPMAALLEVLDPELNVAFRDAYIEVPFDLSEVLFIATANDLSNVPRPLLDRMEVIELESYTPLEKLHIARNHLIPRQCEKYGLAVSQLRLGDEVLTQLIREYTREAGVRGLERRIGEIVRKSIRRMLERGHRSITIGPKVLLEMLGVPPYHRFKHETEAQVGLANGLAWTQIGGEVLQVEAVAMDGSGKLRLTGHMGEVMQESARLAWSYIASIREALGIPKEFFTEKDIHLHIPEGAVPKDGPSAGITMALVMASAATGRKIDAGVAMTGELTVRGRVLAIGGLKEKFLAAVQMGITVLLVPEQNRQDAEKLSEEITSGLTIHYVKDMQQVLDIALL